MIVYLRGQFLLLSCILIISTEFKMCLLQTMTANSPGCDPKALLTSLQNQANMAFFLSNVGKHTDSKNDRALYRFSVLVALF